MLIDKSCLTFVSKSIDSKKQERGDEKQKNRESTGKEKGMSGKKQ